MRNAAWASVAAALMVVLAAQADAPATAPVKTIALDSIYATSGQKELKSVDTGPYLEVTNAPAVVAFAWGKEFKALSKEGLIPATGTKDKLQTLTPPADGDTPLWAVVYFGSTGSSPPQFVIKSATWPKDKQVSVAYDHAPPGPATMDLKPYVAWIPLGKVTAGEYSLQLVTGEKAVAEQKWIVGAKNGSGRGEALQIPAPASVTTGAQKIVVKVPVPADQQRPGSSRR